MQKATKNAVSRANKRKKQKEVFLKKLYDSNGVTLLPLGSYSKIARKLGFSQAYVRFCLTPQYSQWDIKVANEAIKIINAETCSLSEINTAAKEAVARYKEVENG